MSAGDLVRHSWAERSGRGRAIRGAGALALGRTVVAVSLAALVGAAVAAPVAAQGTGTPSSAQAPAPGQAPAARSPAATIDAMKGDLLRLVSANEVYLAKHQSYTDDIAKLPGYKPSAGVKISIVTADADGWSAEASALELPGKDCVIWIGQVKTPPKTLVDSRTASEAAPACDAPLRSARE